MKIDTSNWKEFRIGDLFEIKPAKGKNQQELYDGDDIPYIAASKENNGFNRMVSIEGHEDWVSKGNCLQFIHIGDAAAGHVNYIPMDFIGMSGKSSCAYNEHLNEYTGLFLATVISKANEGKYSFSESWTGAKVRDTVILLPATQTGEPDWDYMENYMTKIMEQTEKKLDTLKKAENVKPHVIDTSQWGTFKVGDLFEIHPTKAYKLTNVELLDDGNNPVVVNSAYNNGVGGYTTKETTEPGNMVTFSDTVDANTIFYQEDPFVGYPHVQGLYPIKYEDKWNRLTYLFFITVFKKVALDKGFNYGNKFRRDIAMDLTIKLPVTPTGEPDWQYMESYMAKVMKRCDEIIERFKKLQAES